MITVPGIYRDITAASYHRPDLTPSPALSSTGIRTLLNRSPLHFYHQHIDPKRPVHKPEFDWGTAIHLAVLEPHLFDAAVVPIDAANWKTNAAKDARDEAYAVGKVPLLIGQIAEVMDARAAIFRHPIARHAFDPANVITEETHVWTDPDTGVWQKCRIDGMARSGDWMIDLKSTVSAHPDDCAKSIVNYGYHIQAAHYLDGAQATGSRCARFGFAFVEKEPPHAVTVGFVTPEMLNEGRRACAATRRKFAQCLETDIWPGYEPDGGGAFEFRFPGWYQRQIENRDDYFAPLNAAAYGG